MRIANPFYARSPLDRWTSRPAAGAPEGLILFDGVCLLCSAWVRYVISHDPERRFRFLPIQSDRGRAFAEAGGISPDAPETNAVVLDGRLWFKSDAALTVLSRLPETRWVRVLNSIPRGIRDPAYDLIARHRYRLFGRSDVCMIPSPADRDRFLT
jgi:predicted DCC family thiol-disulfide oxidoreductase YuxK